MSYSNFYPASGMFHASLPLLMGTRIDVLLFGDANSRLEHVWEGMEKEARMLEKKLNRFDPSSEVAKVNDNAQLATVQLSDELWAIMLDCRMYYERTEGYFDITRTGFEKIIFMEDTHSIQFDNYGMTLDFGGYAKGYALKCMHNRLKEAGISRALINFGNSSMLALGGHPYGDSWPVSIGELPEDIHLCNESLSVSGNSPSRKAHIINPKTAEPVTGEQMVAVVADDPVDAEALTTAWIASGEMNPPDWFKNFNTNKKYRIK